ncbi:MAG: hypothetical protein NTV62_02890, partial [Candidatus Gribaldobacteria bacterium]|nr:hypothetical protein [Candidatus Gribaldobacteria bacterium]
KNSETFGTITNGEKTFSDKCESDNKTISEYYCNNDKSLAEQPEKYLCPFGCFNGACFLSADKIRKANISLIKLSDWGSINGVTVVIANDNSSSELSCLTQGGSCSVNLTPGKYQVFTRDTFFCSKEEGCFKDFELDGTRDIAVSLPVTLKPKSQDMCTETDKRLDYFTKGAVKIWRSPLMLSPIIDYCSLNGRTLNEYYCDGTGYKVEEKDCSGDISSFGSGGCFDGACLRDCTLENSPGYFCGDEQQIEARCGQKDLLKTIEIIKKKVPAGQKCNKAGASICAFCVASCKADNECLNLNCPTASKAKCGSDNKCLCEDQKRCSESSDCGDLKCDQGFEARCGVEQSVQVCFCYQLTSEKYIRFKIRDSISYSLIRGVNVQIIDKKNNNKAVASCVTDQDGRCNIETLNFSSKNQYFVETKNVNQYENFEQEILPENNGRTIFFDIDLVSDDSQDKPDSCSDDSDCDRITCSGANEPACNLQDEKCECVAVEGRLTNVANCADKYGKGYFCSTWADWIDKCGYNNSAKRSLRGIVVCNNNENMSCVTCNEVNSPDTANDCVKRYGAGYSCFTRSDWVNKCDSSDPSLWKSEFICDTNDANKACAACDRTNVVSPVTPLIGSDETSFTIKLYPGADLISSPFNGYPLTIQNLKDAGCILKTNSSFADKFIIYENSVLIPTGQIGLHQAAFVEITNECTVVKKGILPQQSSTFSLSKGLNIFSVALGVPLNQALGSCSGKVLSINSINNQTMGLYSVGNNDTLTPGQGYWIKVSEDCNLNLK